jgi:hypothetical protein
MQARSRRAPRERRPVWDAVLVEDAERRMIHSASHTGRALEISTFSTNILSLKGQRANAVVAIETLLYRVHSLSGKTRVP